MGYKFVKYAFGTWILAIVLAIPLEVTIDTFIPASITEL